MFIERRINPTTNKVELWKCEWENQAGQTAKKVFIEKYCDEKSTDSIENEALTESPAICWSYGRTIGNIAVFTQSVLGAFSDKSGNDAILPCDIVESGKFRHGAARWYCRTHQCYWGTVADHKSFANLGSMICANHQQKMCYEVSPYQVDMTKHAEVGVWCSMPPAISTDPIDKRPPAIHVHIRNEADGKKKLDRDFNAISIKYSGEYGLFANKEIAYVNITPPAAFEFVDALESNRKMDCISCGKCGYPHLDLSDFGLKPHKKHFCGNCGYDSTWSQEPIISTPLKPLHDQFAKTWKFISPERTLNLDEYQGCSYTVWASTPAILWTASRPQELGIHVHVVSAGKRIIDETFSEVILNGKSLGRADLFQQMKSQTII